MLVVWPGGPGPPPRDPQAQKCAEKGQGQTMLLVLSIEKDRYQRVSSENSAARQLRQHKPKLYTES